MIWRHAYVRKSPFFMKKLKWRRRYHESMIKLLLSWIVAASKLVLHPTWRMLKSTVQLLFFVYCYYCYPICTWPPEPLGEWAIVFLVKYIFHDSTNNIILLVKYVYIYIYIFHFIHCISPHVSNLFLMISHDLSRPAPATSGMTSLPPKQIEMLPVAAGRRLESPTGKRAVSLEKDGNGTYQSGWWARGKTWKNPVLTNIRLRQGMMRLSQYFWENANLMATSHHQPAICSPLRRRLTIGGQPLGTQFYVRPENSSKFLLFQNVAQNPQVLKHSGQRKYNWIVDEGIMIQEQRKFPARKVFGKLDTLRCFSDSLTFGRLPGWSDVGLEQPQSCLQKSGESSHMLMQWKTISKPHLCAITWVYNVRTQK